MALNKCFEAAVHHLFTANGLARNTSKPEATVIGTGARLRANSNTNAVILDHARIPVAECAKNITMKMLTTAWSAINFITSYGT